MEVVRKKIMFLYGFTSFNHQYAKPGKYEVVAKVRGIDPETSQFIEVANYKEVEIEYYNLK